MRISTGWLFFHGMAVIGGMAAAFLFARQPAGNLIDTGPSTESESTESRDDLLEIARSTQPADFGSVLTNLLHSENKEQALNAPEAARLLSNRWIAHDPDEVVAFLLENQQDRRALSIVIPEWVKLDAKGAWAAIQGVEELKPRELFENIVLSKVSKIDPDLFFEFQDTLRTESDSLNYYRGNAVKRLAMRDPERAAPLLEGVNGEYQRNETIEALAKAWSRTDWDAALAWAETLESPASRQKAFKTLLMELALTDLEAAESLIDEFGVGSGSRWDAGIFDEVSLNLAKTDAGRAVEWIARHVPENLQDEAARKLVLDADDPELALTLLSALPPGKAREHAASNRFHNWKTGDPKIAWDWIQENLEGNQRQWKSNSLGQSIGSSNFEKAWEFANTLEDSPEKTQFRRQIITGLGKYDIDRAREIARELGDPKLQNDIIAAAVKSRVHRDGDPRELAALLSELPADYEIHDPPHFRIAANWSRQDREASLSWAQSFPAGSKAREKSYEGIAAAWTREDPDGAREWFAVTPSGPERDTAFERIAMVLREENDYPGAFSAALEIGNETERTDSLGRAVKAWMKRDPDAAWNTVDASTLDAAAKERLFRQFQFE